MKSFTAIALVGGVAAELVAKEALPYCETEIKTIGLSWIPVDEFPHAESWDLYQAQAAVNESTYDASQVYPDLEYSTTSAGVPYPTGSNSTIIASSGFPSAASVTLASTATSVATTATSTTTTTTAASSPTSGCSTPRVRTEWRSLSDSQRDAFISGVSCLMNLPSSDSGVFSGSRNLYEDLTSAHQQLAGSIHSSGLFLVWHRYFVHIFEALLREECGYSGPLVWWNESVDSGNFGSAPLFTSRYFGEIQSSIDGRGVCVTESGFGAYEANLGPGSAVNNPHCLSRDLDESLTQNTSQEWVDNCSGAANYDAFRSCVEFT